MEKVIDGEEYQDSKLAFRVIFFGSRGIIWDFLESDSRHQPKQNFDNVDELLPLMFMKMQGKRVHCRSPEVLLFIKDDNDFIAEATNLTGMYFFDQLEIGREHS